MFTDPYAASSQRAYDLIYEAMKDYRLEAERISALIDKFFQSPARGSMGRRSLLDVACGTGLHDQYLDDHFNVTGLDLSPSMLATARRRLPHLEFIEADMRTFSLGRQFDVVTCLFSAIGHLRSFDELKQTIATMYAHLRTGGVIIIEGSFNPETWHDGHIGLDVAEGHNVKVARISTSYRTGNQAHLRLEYLLGQSATAEHPDTIEHFVEHHAITMFTGDEYMIALATMGLEARFLPAGINPNGRGVYVGVKASSL